MKRLDNWIDNFVMNNYDKPVQAFGLFIFIYPLIFYRYLKLKEG